MAIEHYIRRYSGVRNTPSTYSGRHGNDAAPYRSARLIEDEFGGPPLGMDFRTSSASYYHVRKREVLYGVAPYGYRGVRSEIEEAIHRLRYASDGNTAYGRSHIRVLPSMPGFKYRFTCARCGGHRKSSIRTGGMEVVLCAHCQFLNKVRE